MINKKISNPLKATTLGLFVYYAFRLHNSKVDAYAKGTELLSNFHENVMNSIISEIPNICLLYTSPSPRDGLLSRMPSSA